MGYDLTFFAEQPGEDPEDTLERLEEEDDEHGATPEGAERAARLGVALREALPAMRDNAGDRAAAHEVHLLDEAGLEVSVYPRSVTVALPYWASTDHDRVLADLEQVARLVAEHTGWGLYDPQQERWIDVRRDRGGLRDAFEVGREAVRRIEEQG